MNTPDLIKPGGSRRSTKAFAANPRPYNPSPDKSAEELDLMIVELRRQVRYGNLDVALIREILAMPSNKKTQLLVELQKG